MLNLTLRSFMSGTLCILVTLGISSKQKCAYLKNYSCSIENDFTENYNNILWNNDIPDCLCCTNFSFISISNWSAGEHSLCSSFSFAFVLLVFFFWLSLKNHFLRCILYVTACYSILQVFFYHVIKQSVTFFFCFDASFSQLTKSVFCVTE